MSESVMRRVVVVAILAVLTFVGGEAAGAADPPDAVIDLPAGAACAGFGLRVEIRGGNQVFKEFKDRNGRVVRTLSAGRGSALVFTQLFDGKLGNSVSIQPTGSVSRITFNPDGSSTNVTTGHNVLILFPTDIPAGPSTTAYVGRVVYTVDPRGVFELQSVSGTRTDICASLSG